MPLRMLDLKLNNVILKLLPANITSHLQPLDQGIIKAFKACYRKRMMKSLVTKIEQVDSVTELCKEINVLRRCTLDKRYCLCVFLSHFIRS